MKKTFLLLITLSFLFSLVSFKVLATEDNLPAAGITPDNPFYFLKTWQEQIKLFLTFNPANKAKQFLHLAEVRLAEYQKMVEKGKNEIAERTIAKYEKQLNHAIDKIKELKAKNQDTENLSQKLEDTVAKHIAVLEKNLQKAPEQAQKGLQKALEASKKVLEKKFEKKTEEKEPERSDKTFNQSEANKQSRQANKQPAGPVICSDTTCLLINFLACKAAELRMPFVKDSFYVIGVAGLENGKCHYFTKIVDTNNQPLADMPFVDCRVPKEKISGDTFGHLFGQDKASGQEKIKEQQDKIEADYCVKK